MQYFINDKFVDSKEAKVGVCDLGFLRGYGIFDLSLVVNNKAFKERLHLERLKRSADIFDIKLPFSLKKISELTKQLIHKNKKPYSRIRWILSGGLEDVKKPTFIIVQEDQVDFPESCYEKGIKVITIDKRREMPEAKSLNYQILYSNKDRMKKEGADEMIYTPENQVLEATTSNVFIIKDKEVFTPKKDILPGITRKIVIDLCRNNNIKLNLRKISKDELLSADEVFITASNKRVMPVTKVDQKLIAEGSVGAVTSGIIKLFGIYEEEWGRNSAALQTKN